VAAVTTATLAGAAHASVPVERVVPFDASAGELPESVVVDHRGTAYVTLAPIGQVRSIAPNGSQHVVATLPTGSGFGATGLAFGSGGDLYVAVSTFDPKTNGVYVVHKGGSVEGLPGTQDIVLPNGLALDDKGNLFVTDSAGGSIWRVPPGGKAELWLSDPLLAGDNSAPPPVPLGANGIAFRAGRLLVTNTEKGSVLTVPIRADGRPGAPSVLVQGPKLVGADGLTLDSRGRLYVAVNGQSRVVRISPQGTAVRTLATAADGLDSTSGVAFAPGDTSGRALYLVNFAIGPVFGFPPGAGPSLMALDLRRSAP
jgi:sugar lactone lactonase YvrE